MTKPTFEHEQGDTPFGIFHPTGYIIAAFDSDDVAARAADKLLADNFESDKVAALSGADVREAIENAHPPDTLLENLKQALAKGVGTEGYFWDKDLDMAKQGAGFVSVYCADADQAHQATAVLKPLNPKALRRYRKFAIEDLLQSPLPGN